MLCALGGEAVEEAALGGPDARLFDDPADLALSGGDILIETGRQRGLVLAQRSPAR